MQLSDRRPRHVGKGYRHREDATVAELRIQLLGEFRVQVDGAAVPAGAWRGRRPAALVKLLALAPQHRLHREQLMDTLWRGGVPPRAGAGLRTTAPPAPRAL